MIEEAVVVIIVVVTKAYTAMYYPRTTRTLLLTLLLVAVVIQYITSKAKADHWKPMKNQNRAAVLNASSCSMVNTARPALVTTEATVTTRKTLCLQSTEYNRKSVYSEAMLLYCTHQVPMSSQPRGSGRRYTCRSFHPSPRICSALYAR